mmetsp:Transcript_6121/g.15525  ORF Transcript_6121/g.15525 Transcript_6121/m.15525 type:complete len:223 (+) Transcript_6121:1880-2548(+)
MHISLCWPLVFVRSISSVQLPIMTRHCATPTVWKCGAEPPSTWPCVSCTNARGNAWRSCVRWCPTCPSRCCCAATTHSATVPIRTTSLRSSARRRSLVAWMCSASSTLSTTWTRCCPVSSPPAPAAQWSRLRSPTLATWPIPLAPTTRSSTTSSWPAPLCSLALHTSSASRIWLACSLRRLPLSCLAPCVPNTPICRCTCILTIPLVWVLPRVWQPQQQEQM